MAKKIFKDDVLVGFEPGVIYELRFTHSGVDIPFYVGETTDPERRLAEHIYGAKTATADSETKYQFIANALDAHSIPWTLVPAIGVCAAVPMHEITHWLRMYKEHGAVFTWWNTPVNSAQRAIDPMAGKRQRRQLDHAQVYKMLDAGKTSKEIAQALDFPRENIDYVFKKWKNSVPLDVKYQKPRIDAVALVRDYHAGASPKELADQYNTAVAYVYKLIGSREHS